MLTIAFVLLMFGTILSIPRAHADSGTTINGFTYHPLTYSEYCYPNNSGNYCVGIAGTLLKDTTETDPNNDYYGIKLSMFSINATTSSTFVTDLTASIQVNLPPSEVGPVAGGIQPPTGTVQQQTTVQFCDSGGGVCVSTQVPSGTITESNNQGSSTDTFNWHVTQTSNILNGGNNEADFGVIIIVPENTQFTVSLSGSMTFSWAGFCNSNLECSSNSYPVDGTLYTQPNSTPDFWTTIPSAYLQVCPGTQGGMAVTMSSMNGFSGTVNVAASITPNDGSAFPAYTSRSVTPTSSPLDAIFVSLGQTTTYTVTVTLTSGSLSHFISFTAVGTNGACGGGGGGGSGSVAYGSLITLADGSKVPVQNISVGDEVIVYNVPTGYQTVAIVYQIVTHTVNNTLTIHTTAGGTPFRADANPAMKLWVLTANGPVEKPITTIQSGDQIYNYDLGHWVSVTDITITYGGLHTVYDLLTTPNFSNGLLLEYIANGYPDCPPRGCKT